ncbi:MAG: hypothetical protein IJ580_06155 [Prevotella sp.]|nr:hypothetical protein [Prevotella sp.]
MKRCILHIWFLALTAAMLFAGCRETSEDIEPGIPVNVDLAFSFSSTSPSAKTRLGDGDLVGNVANIEILRVIPMKDNTPDNLGEVTISSDDAVSKTTAKFYRSNFCSMATGDDGCLVYAKDNRASRIDATIPTSITSTRQIGFRLSSIFQGTDVPPEATTLAGYLNTVANTTSWQASDNAILNNLFNNFTNHGYNLPGSAASVKQWLMSLASVAQSYLDNPPSSIGEDHKTILTAIKNNATTEAAKITVDNEAYPRNIGLPDGAAALRWTSGSGFTPRLQTTTLDNINSVSRFAYPPSLYYFVNSTLLTSDSKVITTAYANDTWTAVKESFTAGPKISSSTKSVILADEVEYAVSRLEVKVWTENASWTYPLKGIIVCGQRPVNYMFEQDNNYNSDVKFVYDSNVETCSLSSTETLACRTLVFQSYDGEDVDIILEFENNGESFECSDGTVYPDTRFYLIGKVELSKVDGAARAFTKDYTTTVSMKVTSLDKAYNVLPSLLSSNLEIGVETTPKWVSDKPTVIRLE